jgi:threonine aldolase
MALTHSVNHSHRMVDLRSDTVTRPTAAMRAAMFEAEVGDDVFGDDPTVLQLEHKMSTLFRKECALFFPSGTMSNLAATMSWCSKRGSEMILGDSSHMFLYEQGGISQIAGVLPRCMKNERDGSIDLDTIEKAVRDRNIHFPVTEVIAIEDTHNFCGGRVVPKGYLDSVGVFAKTKEIAVHLDGARIWNAATASNTPVHDLVAGADSVSVCLSKGLGAPSGSILLGPRDFIQKARRCRKALGGSMHQLGILAAAGIQGIADFEAGLLLPDHLKAKQLATAISEIPGFDISMDDVETNIVLIGVKAMGLDPAVIAAMLKEKNVLVLPFGENRLRLVTHRDIVNAEVEFIISAFRDVSAIIHPQPLSTGQIAAGQELSPERPLSISIAPIPDIVEKTVSTRLLIEAALHNEDVFRPRLSAREIDAIVDGAEGIRVAPGDTVMRQGDTAQFFYIIESGRVDRIYDDIKGPSSRISESLTRSMFFGETALIYEKPRSATVIAAEETVVWRIHKKHFFFVCKQLNGMVDYAEAVAKKIKDISDSPTSEAVGWSSADAANLVQSQGSQVTSTLLPLYGPQTVIVETDALMLADDTMSESELMKDGSELSRTAVKTPDEANLDSLRVLGHLEAGWADRKHCESNGKEAFINHEKDAQHFEEVVIHGMSLSDDGFCVLLRGAVCERVLRVLITPSDPMSDGLDRDQVDTSEAVTLLQLLQGIDVETVLARDVLQTKFADARQARQQYLLQRVMIDNVDSMKNFHATLHGTTIPSGSAHAASLKGDIAFPISVVPQHSFDHPIYETLTYSSPPMTASDLVPSNEGVGALARKSSMQSSGQRPQDENRISKEVELESAFESIALALRHSAVIEVRSSLLQHESVSYSLEELPSFFPKLVKSDVPVKDRGRFGVDYDAHSEIERLQRRLHEAILQGNTSKIDPIMKQLDFYGHIDGKGLLVLPPPPVFLAPVIDVVSSFQAEG